MNRLLLIIANRERFNTLNNQVWESFTQEEKNVVTFSRYFKFGG